MQCSIIGTSEPHAGKGTASIHSYGELCRNIFIFFMSPLWFSSSILFSSILCDVSFVPHCKPYDKSLLSIFVTQLREKREEIVSVSDDLKFGIRISRFLVRVLRGIIKYLVGVGVVCSEEALCCHTVRIKPVPQQLLEGT